MQGERVRLAQFSDRQAARLRSGGAGRAQLVVAIVEMLGQLVEDLALALGAQAQRRETRAQVGDPFISHGRLR
jgi:hypothetical protein